MKKLRKVLSIVSFFRSISVATENYEDSVAHLRHNKFARKNAKRAIRNCDEALVEHDKNQENSNVDRTAERAAIVAERELHVGRLSEARGAREGLKYLVDTNRKSLRNSLKQARKFANKPARKTIKAALNSL